MILVCLCFEMSHSVLIFLFLSVLDYGAMLMYKTKEKIIKTQTCLKIVSSQEQLL